MVPSQHFLRLWKLTYALRHPHLLMPLLRFGLAPSLEHMSTLRRLRPAPRTILDVGAHQGQFTLLVSEHLPHATIHAFEPLSHPRQQFRAALGDVPTVSLHGVALSDYEGWEHMNVARNSDSSSLLDPSEEQKRLFRGTRVVGSEKVRIARLDDYLDITTCAGPALMKVDVQGSEARALKGAERTLSFIEYVIVEVSFRELYTEQPLVSEIIRYLFSAGFDLEYPYNVTGPSNSVPVQADLLFRKR